MKYDILHIREIKETYANRTKNIMQDKVYNIMSGDDNNAHLTSAIKTVM